jgi:hypothetical protein
MRLGCGRCVRAWTELSVPTSVRAWSVAPAALTIMPVIPSCRMHTYGYVFGVSKRWRKGVAHTAHAYLFEFCIFNCMAYLLQHPDPQ